MVNRGNYPREVFILRVPVQRSVTFGAKHWLVGVGPEDRMSVWELHATRPIDGNITIDFHEPGTFVLPAPYQWSPIGETPLTNDQISWYLLVSETT